MINIRRRVVIWREVAAGRKYANALKANDASLLEPPIEYSLKHALSPATKIMLHVINAAKFCMRIMSTYQRAAKKEIVHFRLSSPSSSDAIKCISDCRRPRFTHTVNIMNIWVAATAYTLRPPTPTQRRQHPCSFNCTVNFPNRARFNENGIIPTIAAHIRVYSGWLLVKWLM